MRVAAGRGALIAYGSLESCSFTLQPLVLPSAATCPRIDARTLTAPERRRHGRAEPLSKQEIASPGRPPAPLIVAETLAGAGDFLFRQRLGLVYGAPAQRSFASPSLRLLRAKRGPAPSLPSEEASWCDHMPRDDAGTHQRVPGLREETAARTARRLCQGRAHPALVCGALPRNASRASNAATWHGHGSGSPCRRQSPVLGRRRRSGGRS